jgi:hypothetical protein
MLKGITDDDHDKTFVQLFSILTQVNEAAVVEELRI